MTPFFAAFELWISKKYATPCEKIFFCKKRGEQLVFKVEHPEGDFFLKFPLTEKQSAILAAESFIRGHILRHSPDFPCHSLTLEGTFRRLPVYGERAFAGTDLAREAHTADLRAVFPAVLDALARLREVPLPKVLPTFIQPPCAPRGWLASFSRRLHGVARAASARLEPGLVARLFRFMDMRLAAMPAPQLICLVHNDLDPGNIIVSTAGGKTTLSGIIDFERFIFGDPLKEFSRFIWLLRRNPGLGNWLWKRYAALFQLSEKSLISVEIYWLYDMLNQTLNERELITDIKWRQYILENKQIISAMLSGEFKLW